MDERAMTALPPILTLPACFLGGLALGHVYFLMLRGTADLIVGRGGPFVVLLLTSSRFALVGAGLYLAVLTGGLGLLAALAGILCVKALVLRRSRQSRP